MSNDTTKWLTCAETAKLIRADLAKHFPGIKFSVRSKTYSGGSSVNIDWTDGPTGPDVESITNKYAGKGFDGMIDMAYYNRHWLMPDGTIQYAGTSGTEGSHGVVPADKPVKPAGAVEIHLGAGYIFCQRDCSVAMYERAAEQVAKFWGIKAPAISLGQWGEIIIENQYDCPGNGYDDLRTLIYRELRDMPGEMPQPPAPTPEPKKPANVVELRPGEPATSRQLWALHCITKQDTRGWKLTRAEASNLISKAKSGEDIKSLVVGY